MNALGLWYPICSLWANDFFIRDHRSGGVVRVCERSEDWKRDYFDFYVDCSRQNGALGWHMDYDDFGLRGKCVHFDGVFIMLEKCTYSI